MATEAKFLIVQFLEWVAAKPRRVADARAAWPTRAPRGAAPVP
jgi:hypothetical protein